MTMSSLEQAIDRYRRAVVRTAEATLQTVAARRRIEDDARQALLALVERLQLDARRWELALALSIIDRGAEGQQGEEDTLTMKVALGSLATIDYVPERLRHLLTTYYLHEEADVREMFDLAMPVTGSGEGTGELADSNPATVPPNRAATTDTATATPARVECWAVRHAQGMWDNAEGTPQTFPAESATRVCDTHNALKGWSEFWPFVPVRLVEIRAGEEISSKTFPPSLYTAPTHGELGAMGEFLKLGEDERLRIVNDNGSSHRPGYFSPGGWAWRTLRRFVDRVRPPDEWAAIDSALSATQGWVEGVVREVNYGHDAFGTVRHVSRVIYTDLPVAQRVLVRKVEPDTVPPPP